FVPQVLPSTAFEPVSVQTGAPLEQATAPTWQIAPAGVQVVLLVHATHAPPEHTWLAPQDVPSAVVTWVAAHTGTPVEHSIAPCTQGLVGTLHWSPTLHAVHAP